MNEQKEKYKLYKSILLLMKKVLSSYDLFLFFSVSNYATREVTTTIGNYRITFNITTDDKIFNIRITHKNYTNSYYEGYKTEDVTSLFYALTKIK